MKLIRTLSKGGMTAFCLALATGLSIGCRSTDEPTFSSDLSLGAPAGPSTNPVDVGYRFAVGDQLTITLIGPEPPLLPHEEQIKEDGTITMPLIGSFKAAGKTAGDLQKEIHDRYVPKYYTRLTVTVTSKNLSYYVGGEVKVEAPKAYLGETTLTKAIQAGGGFTDFANRKKIKLTRGGKTTIHNWYKIQENPSLDPLVIPGDRIEVPRRLF